MVKKQLLAQIGVFLLLGVNVAAYWILWPNYHGVSSHEPKPVSQEKGTNRLVPESATKPLPPKEIAPASFKDAVPLSATPAEKVTPEQEALNKLFDHIKNDPAPQVTLPLDRTPSFAPPVTLPSDRTPAFAPPETKPGGIEEKPEPFPPVPNPFAPKSLPPLEGEGVRHEVEPVVAVTSALTPKMQPSPWSLQMEMIGTRKQLHARLRQPGAANIVADFKILCDRVEMKSPGGEVLALGNVTVVGAGINAACNRLTLPIHETRLVFEEQARITHQSAVGSVLRGERIHWEMPVQTMPVLGGPK